MDNSLKYINYILIVIVGILLLTCVLAFIHVSTASIKTVSEWSTVLTTAGTILGSFATVGTFYIAQCVYRKVPDWLAPKLNDKKFVYADELIEGFCTLQQEALHVFSDVYNFLNLPPDQNFNLTNDLIILNIKIEKYVKNIILLTAKTERMTLWGLTPKNKKDLYKILSSHEKMYIGLIAARELKTSNKSNKIEGLLETNKNMLTIYSNLSEDYKLIIRPYDQLFEK